MHAGTTKEKDDESGKALALAKTFDSFDATLRLAAMTDQTDDFRDYITATQKMRAYKGKIEATSPLAAQNPQLAPVEEKRAAPRPAPAAAPSMNDAAASSQSSNFMAVIAIIVLSVAAVGLTIALLVK
jgi:hypothetical protein